MLSAKNWPFCISLRGLMLTVIKFVHKHKYSVVPENKERLKLDAKWQFCGICIIPLYLFKSYFKFHYHSNQNLLKYFDAYTRFFCPRSLRWDSYNHLHFWLYDLLYILPSNHYLMKSINISLNFCHKIKYWTQAAVMELYRVLVVGTENDSIAGDFRLRRAWLLTHWLLGNFNEFFRTCNFQTDFSDWWLRYLLWNCT